MHVLLQLLMLKLLHCITKAKALGKAAEQGAGHLQLLILVLSTPISLVAARSVTPGALLHVCTLLAGKVLGFLLHVLRAVKEVPQLLNLGIRRYAIDGTSGTERTERSG